MPANEHQEHLPLTEPVYHILMALADGDRHGYAILREVEARTDGSLRLRTGTLYTALRRLLEQQLVEETDERPDPELDDARRRYYRITALGRVVLEAEARRLEAMVGLARAKAVLAADGRAR